MEVEDMGDNDLLTKLRNQIREGKQSTLSEKKNYLTHKNEITWERKKA